MSFAAMKHLIVALVLTAAGQPAEASDSVILVLGDSLSAGRGIAVEDSWVSLLQQKLDSQGYGYRVVNASVSGDTTGGGLARLPRALALHQPEILIIELGGNDGLRGTPIEEIRLNLSRAIETGLEAGARVVLAGMQMPPNYGEQYAGGFRNLYPDLADDYHLPFIPFLLDGVALDPALMQNDGFHPNAAGQRGILANVWAALETVIASSP
ncbi:MAG: arylesterase [Gammaproteobacteria bacterium]